jgi:hypothetical protein
MGFPGWGPAQELLSLDDGLALDPEHVVLGLYTGNDLVDAYTSIYDGNRLRDLRTADRAARESFEELDDRQPFDSDLLAHQDADGLARRRRRDTPSSLLDLIAANSKLYGLGVAVRRAVERLGDDNQADGPDDDSDDLVLQTEKSSTILTPGYRAQAVELADPRVAEGLRLTLAVLDQLRARSAAAGAGLQVLLIPTKERVLSDVVDEQVAEVPSSYRRLVQHEDELRQRLRAELADRQIGLIDALPALQALVAAGEIPYSQTRDGHLNALGQQTVAQLVRAAIAQ